MPRAHGRLSHFVPRKTIFPDTQTWKLWLAIGTLMSFMLLGGGPISAGFGAAVMLGMGAACILAFGPYDGFSRLAGLPAVELLCWIGILAIPVLQLIPLPPSIWTALPGRDVENQILALVGQSSAWLPLTLDRAATLSTLTMTLALGGVLLATLALPDRSIRLLMIALVAFVAFSLFVGTIQLSSAGRLLTFYPTSHRGLLLGFFANRNHEALLLAISILAVGYLVGTSRIPQRYRLSLFGFYAFIAFSAAFGTASRMGLALCLVASFAVPFLFLGTTIARKGYAWVAAGVLVLFLAGLASLSGRAGSALERYGDVGGDYRWTLWERSAALLASYFPVGTGLGSFADVYQKYERLEWLLPNYVNDAHNDYIQLVVEAGLPGAMVLLLLIATLVRTALITRPPDRHGRTGPTNLAKLGIAIILLILVHSVVDYPLRRPAIAVIFTLALALVFRQRVKADKIAPQAFDSAAA